MTAGDASDAPARPGWLPEHLLPFQSRHVDVDGTKVHCVDEGDGPALLLMHGNPTYSFLYRELITGLRDRFRIAIDYPAGDPRQPAVPRQDRGRPADAGRPRALLVWPTKQVAFRPTERRRWEAVFPDHRTVMLEGAGH